MERENLKEKNTIMSLSVQKNYRPAVITYTSENLYFN